MSKLYIRTLSKEERKLMLKLGYDVTDVISGNNGKLLDLAIEHGETILDALVRHEIQAREYLPNEPYNSIYLDKDKEHLYIHLGDNRGEYVKKC